MNQTELKRHNAKMRQRKCRAKKGQQTYSILYCSECFWIFDRKLEGSNICPKCKSDRTYPAVKIYGKAAYNFQLTQTPYKHNILKDRQ